MKLNVLEVLPQRVNWYRCADFEALRQLGKANQQDQRTSRILLEAAYPAEIITLTGRPCWFNLRKQSFDYIFQTQRLSWINRLRFGGKYRSWLKPEGVYCRFLDPEDTVADLIVTHGGNSFDLNNVTVL